MSDYSKLIGLTGFAGAGKDLVAAMLKIAGYTRFGFADAVREEVQASFENEADLPMMPEHIFQDWSTCSRVNIETGAPVLYEKPMLPQARRLLQWWGTEFRRTEDPDYWIKKISAKVLFDSNNPQYFTSRLGVISDVRFLNEANWIERWDGIIWRIERPGLKSDGHVSESQSEFIKADYTIKNDGDLQNLANQVLTALEVFRAEPEASKTRGN